MPAALVGWDRLRQRVDRARSGTGAWSTRPPQEESAENLALMCWSWRCTPRSPPRRCRPGHRPAARHRAARPEPRRRRRRAGSRGAVRRRARQPVHRVRPAAERRREGARREHHHQPRHQRRRARLGPARAGTATRGGPGAANATPNGCRIRACRAFQRQRPNAPRSARRRLPTTSRRCPSGRPCRPSASSRASGKRHRGGPSR